MQISAEAKMTWLLEAATALLAMAAFGGALMVAIRFSGRTHPPSWLAMGHGFLASAGLTLLIYTELTVGLPMLAELALGLAIAAAIGGVTLNLLFHVKNKPLPIPLMLLHAVLALSAFVLLLMSVL